MNYLDLFSGIGGFALGFERAGWKFDKHYYSEIDKYAIQIYKKHFPDAIPVGDVRHIKPEKLGQIDLITFGFPCQDLSIAGKRKGLGGARSGLFFEATRLIRHLKPSLFIFENVEGLLTSNDGKDFEVVLREIADIGLYECEWQLLNTSWFLPQNRERVYFIGHLGKGSRRKIFPIGTDDKPANELSGQPITNCLKARYEAIGDGSYIIEGELNAQAGIRNIGLKQIGFINTDSQGQRVYDPEGVSAQLTAQGGGWGAKTGLYMIDDPSRKDGIVDKNESPTIRSEAHGNLPCVVVPEATKQGYAVAEEGDGINLSQPNSKTRRGRVQKGAVSTLDTQTQQFTLQAKRIRRLTPTECERLQGFPDGWTAGVSETQRYRCLGNAVTVNVVAEIAKRLLAPEIEAVGSDKAEGQKAV